MKTIDILKYFRLTKWRIIAAIISFVIIGVVPIPDGGNLFRLSLVLFMAAIVLPGASFFVVLLIFIPHLLISYAIACGICFVVKKEDYSTSRKIILIAIAVLFFLTVLLSINV